MISAKKLLLAGAALGLALSTAPIAMAAGVTAGLSTISLRGVGQGGLAGGPCLNPPIACPTGDVCQCLTITDTVVGTMAFNQGSLNVILSINTSHALPITAGGSCLGATGQGNILSKNSKQGIDILVSGIACSTVGDTIETFNGTYVLTGGVGSFSSANGTGAVNGSAEGTTTQAVLTGSVQK